MPVEKVSSTPGDKHLFCHYYWGVIYLQSNTYLLHRVWDPFLTDAMLHETILYQERKAVFVPKKVTSSSPFHQPSPSPSPKCPIMGSILRKDSFSLDWTWIGEKIKIKDAKSFVAQTTGWLRPALAALVKPWVGEYISSCALTRQVQEAYWIPNKRCSEKSSTTKSEPERGPGWRRKSSGSHGCGCRRKPWTGQGQQGSKMKIKGRTRSG